MSAIWGMIDINKNKLIDNVDVIMKDCYKDKKIDTIKEIKDSGLYIACGLQYITPESRVEVNPFFDKDNNNYFVGDVYLFNRDELIKKENLKTENTVFTDSEIIYKIYLKYGREGFKKISGIYTFIIYNTISNEIIIVADKTSSRMLYYRFIDGVLCFSTLNRAIRDVYKKENNINMRWITDFIAIDGLVNISETVETPYKDINKISAGKYIVINKDGISEIEYFNPLKEIKKTIKNTEEYYKETFLRTFKNSIRDSVRTDGNVAILLSSGLDSTAVACFAADELEKKKKNLYSYTSIPLKGYKVDAKESVIVDESNLVLETAKLKTNIIPEFIEYEDTNIWAETERLMEEFEFPYKSLQNIVWIEESLNKAAANGCKVMLNGQYGNTTISFGDMDIYLFTLLRRGRFVKLLKELKGFNKTYKIQRKAVVIDLLKGLIPSKKNLLLNTYINDSYLEKYVVKKRFLKAGVNIAGSNYIDYNKYRNYIYYKNALSQIGEFETKSSLRTGVMIIDPTKTDDLIELCLKMPMENFASNGHDRRLVREYMKENLPDKIINNHKPGLQSADLSKRIEKYQYIIKKELLEIVNTDLAKELLDYEKIIKDIENLELIMENEENGKIYSILFSILSIKFLKKNSNSFDRKLVK